MDWAVFFHDLYYTDSAVGNLLANVTRMRGPVNLLDIALLCAFLFIILSQLAKSPVRRLLNGMMLILVLLSAVTSFQGLAALNFFMANSYLVLLVSIPIIFQSEIRELLSELGAGAGVWDRLFRGQRQPMEDLGFVNEVVDTVRHLRSRRLGALIVLRGQDRLPNTLNDGTDIDALCTSQVLSAIFEKRSLIHDGAVIIEQGRIQRANVLFQLQEEGEAPELTGTRHAAARTITHHNDALCIVVSEETGTISLSRQGMLGILQPEDLATELYRLLGQRVAVGTDLHR